MGIKKIETYEQKEKALKWMVEMAEHPLNPVVEDPKTAKIYAATEKAVQEFNAQNIPNLYEGIDDLKDASEKPKEPTTDHDSWL